MVKINFLCKFCYKYGVDFQKLEIRIILWIKAINLNKHQLKWSNISNLWNTKIYLKFLKSCHTGNESWPPQQKSLFQIAHGFWREVASSSISLWLRDVFDVWQKSTVSSKSVWPDLAPVKLDRSGFSLFYLIKLPKNGQISGFFIAMGSILGDI